MGDKNFCRNLLTVDQFLNSSLIKAGGERLSPSRLFPAGEKY
jgi:hypothetical protein